MAPVRSAGTARGVPPRAVHTDERAARREGLAIELYHTHLPTLPVDRVADFDPECRTVWFRPDGRTERVLDSLPLEPSPARPRAFTTQ